MNILVYGINFYPELTGIGKYTGDMCFELARKHDVSMISAFPYYPNWKVQAPYSNRWWKKEVIRGVKVIRCPLFVPEKVSSIKRILHECSFLFSSSFALLSLLFKPIDVVVCIVTPFHLGIPARLFSWFKRVPMVYHIQDLQVNAARDLKMIQNEWLLQKLEKAERWILKQTDITATISMGMIAKIKEKGISTDKIVFFPNWVDTQFIHPLSQSESLKQEWGFKNEDCIILYSGNLGEKQGLEMIVDIAYQMRNNLNLHFVIVGNGGMKHRLQATVQEKELNNIHFFPLQPYEKLSALLAIADLHLVLQKRAAADLVLPSKLTSILAVGGCAIVTADEGSTLYDLIDTYQMGILVNTDSITALKDGIEKGLSIDIQFIKNNARSYAEAYLDKNKILSRFEVVLQNITSGVSPN